MASDTRVQDLIDRFTAANEVLIQLMEGCSAKQQNTRSEQEGRMVAVLARHVAVSHLGVLGWVRALARGEKLPELTMEMIHGVNASHVDEWKELDHDETLRLLRENGETVVEALRGLSDDHLDQSAAFSLYGGRR